MSRPRKVIVTEVGPRDGFQIERDFVPTATKIEMINELIDAGLPRIEVTSFVSPRAVPQLADAAEVLAGIDRATGTELIGAGAERQGRRARRRGRGRRALRVRLGVRDPQPQEPQPQHRGIARRLRGGDGDRRRGRHRGARRDRHRVRLPVRGRRAGRAGRPHRAGAFASSA